MSSNGGVMMSLDNVIMQLPILRYIYPSIVSDQAIFFLPIFISILVHFWLRCFETCNGNIIPFLAFLNLFKKFTGFCGESHSSCCPNPKELWCQESLPKVIRAILLVIHLS